MNIFCLGLTYSVTTLQSERSRYQFSGGQTDTLRFSRLSRFYSHCSSVNIVARLRAGRPWLDFR